MRRTIKRAALTVLLIGGAAAGYGVWTGKLPIHKKSETADARQTRIDASALAPAVTVARAEMGDFQETVTLSGTVVPRDEILVGPEVEGLRIVEVLADEGDRVAKGQTLARLVSDTLDAQVAQNVASQARAEANIGQQRSNIASAEARVTEAKNALDRGRPLRQSGYLSDAVLDQRESSARTANAQLEAAKDALRVAEAERAQIVAQRRELDWKRSRTDIVAPAEGIVSRRLARVGGFAAGASDSLFRIIARGEVEVESEVPEGRIARMKEGQQARVQLVDGSTVTGTVRIVSPEIDRQSRLGRVRIFLGAVPAAKVGSFARASVETSRSRGIAVPSAAVQFGEIGASVLLVADRKVASRRVKVGLVVGGQTEITDGLKAGDVVVARSGTFLRDGDAINPVESARLSEAGQ